MSTNSFWKRVSHFFGVGTAEAHPTNGNGHGNGNGNGHEAATPPESAIEVATPPTEDRAPEPAHESGEWPRSSSSLLRWGRREPSLSQLREGYQHLVDLMDTMRRHFERQDQRADQMTRSMDQLAGILGRLAESQQAQGECVRTIAAHVDAAGQHAAALSETLSHLPASMQVQAQACQSMLRQMEIAQETDTQLGHSLQRLGHAVESLQASSTAQVETLQQIHSAERGQKDALMALVHEQNRKFFWTMTVAAVLGLGALAAMGVTLALVLNK